nr:hypothetical protein BHI3_30390 [Bacteriovorax sp. HI3]
MKTLLMMTLLALSTTVFAKGGDDAGNGGFAYKQSIKILKMASEELEDKIAHSMMQDLTDYPERREILQRTLKYDNLRQLYFWVRYRDGKKLAMDYQVKPARVTILAPYYQAFAGKTDTELEDASLEVQKRLLHEASHIWGYNEAAAEKFSIAFLAEQNDLPRPTKTIGIKPDFCSCRMGRPDIVNGCDSFCAIQPYSTAAILYVNTTPEADVALNPKLGNLYNWCTAQLNHDEVTPQCVLNAWDGANSINIPVTLKKDSNSFSANISQLSTERTWILKLVENKTGSNAQTREFQVRRKELAPEDGGVGGALKIAPANQYTCLLYGGKTDAMGEIIRTTYVRKYYYYPNNETPAPVPAVGGARQSQVVCHDEQLHPGADSYIYERLELERAHFLTWDKADLRFTYDVASSGKLRINKILEDRLSSEFGINATLSLFNLLNYSNRPSSLSTNPSNVPVGYVMVPFSTVTGTAFCPTATDFQGNQPLLSLLGDYMHSTEALYIAEKEPETIQDGTSYKTFYGTMLITDSELQGIAFTIENGVKKLVTRGDYHSKRVYYYWPKHPMLDPLSANNRKLFVIKSPNELNENSMSGLPISMQTSDKRIGCVPRK